MSRKRILVIDDDEAIRRTLGMTLGERYEILTAASGIDGLQETADKRPDAVLLDIKMPIMDGLEVLEKLQERHPDVPVVMISGHAEVPDAVEAIRKGARDLLEKPLSLEIIQHRLEALFEHEKVASQLSHLKEEERRRLQEEAERYRMVGDGAAIRALRAEIERAAPTHATVLITGESGTGKELVAREIHQRSPRRDRPFIKVNCAAIPEDLIESELFGHEKGSFTGATGKQVGKFVQADGGTIFLDEIGDMSPRTQAKVLRVLQEGDVEPVGAGKVIRVDVRVVAATNKDLSEEIRRGRFREDLLFRLNVVPLRCPPLRERTEDVPQLVEHFVQRFCIENNSRPRTIAAAAVESLQRHPWPGNVRELRNVVERMLIMSPDEEVAAALLPAPPVAGGPAVNLDHHRTLKEFKEAAEREFLIRMLDRNDWNISQTAKEIDTPRSNLYKKLEQYGLAKEKSPDSSEADPPQED